MRFEDALSLAGLLAHDVKPDGRIHRCPTEAYPHQRRGWWALHGDHGVWGDWSSGSGEALGTWHDENAHPVERSMAQLEENRRQRERDRAWLVKSIAGARQFWNAARPLRNGHPYLDAKGLSAVGCAGLRVANGMLVAPVISGGVISVQTIAADGAKRFWTGAPVKGGVYIIERPGSALTAVCEGLATGLAIAQSIKLARVVVAFNAGNLTHALQRLRPSGAVVVVADNDHKTAARIGSNPGIEFAKRAAELSGAGIIWPTGIEGSDIADYLKETGDGAHKRVERMILGAAKYVRPP